jgi:hypothetical protein
MTNLRQAMYLIPLKSKMSRKPCTSKIMTEKSMISLIKRMMKNQKLKKSLNLKRKVNRKKNGQAMKVKGQWRRPGGDNETERESSPAITTIQIIRSSKPAAYDEEAQATKKNKKKKRSKAVGPATSKKQQ